MKYGIVISAAETSFGEIILKGDLETNIRKAAEFGYDGIELAVKDPSALDIDLLGNLLRENDMDMPVIGTGQIFFDEGLSFTDPDEEVRLSAVERVCEIADIAREFNSAVIIGLVRGTVPEKTLRENPEGKERALAGLRASMRDCLTYTNAWNGRFLLEPMHRYHTNIINTLDDAREFIHSDDHIAASGRVSILADTWHMNIEETNMTSSVFRNRDLVSHIHFADSNRKAPGYGHIDFHTLYSVLEEIGYEGYGSFEVVPWPSEDVCAREALTYMKQIERRVAVSRMSAEDW